MSIFAELSYVIAVATAMAFVMRLLKQPLIIGHILTGIIVGPFVLGVIESEETFETFASLGIVLLLFIIGLGLNPKVIKDVGKVAVITGSAQVAGTTILGVLLAMSPVVGLSLKPAIFVGLALAFSSTIIILKLIGDKKELTRLYGKITIGMLLVQDILATLALVFVAAGSGGEVTAADIGSLLLRSVLLGTVIYMIGARILPHLQNMIASSQEFLFLFALGWGFSVASLFDLIGFSLEVGALFAGIALASLPYAQEISAKLKPLRDFFIVVFFISLGTHLGIDDVASVILPAIALSAFVILFNPTIIAVVLGLQGYSKSTSFKAGIAMAQISEFSLVLIILAQRQGLIDSSIVSLTTMVAIITIAISSYMIIYTDQIYAWFEKNFKTVRTSKIRLRSRQVRARHNSIWLSQRWSRIHQAFPRHEKEFVVVDYDPENIDAMERRKVPHIFGDATDPEILGEIEADKAKMIISVITDYETNKFLITEIMAANNKAVMIVQADTPEEAMDLYAHGASYVVLPHYVGSERIGTFIKNHGFAKTDYKKYKQKHISYIETSSRL
jgi:Kef-type K+ transport system membrane component KefB